MRKAYRRRALQTHPDRLPQNVSPEDKKAAEEQFRLVNNAYEVLNNPENRKVRSTPNRQSQLSLTPTITVSSYTTNTAFGRLPPSSQMPAAVLLGLHSGSPATPSRTIPSSAVTSAQAPARGDLSGPSPTHSSSSTPSLATCMQRSTTTRSSRTPPSPARRSMTPSSVPRSPRRHLGTRSAGRCSARHRSAGLPSAEVCSVARRLAAS